MFLSKASVTALHALVELGKNGGSGPLSVEEVARAVGVSRAYLAKILQRVSRAELIRSRRGPSGGYVLGRSPARISLFEISEAVDGPVVTGRCEMLLSDRCARFVRCRLRRRLDRARVCSSRVYRGIRLSEFLRRPAAGRAGKGRG